MAATATSTQQQPPPITAEWATKFAHEWIDTWNSHDLDKIMAHYTDDFEMTSPVIITRMKEPSGTVKGKENVRKYWDIGIKLSNPPLKFEYIQVLLGVYSITIYYKNAAGKFVAEVLHFNNDLVVTRGSANYSP